MKSKIALLFVVLAACGGSGTEPETNVVLPIDVEPLAATGFARESDTLGGTYDLSVPNVPTSQYPVSELISRNIEMKRESPDGPIVVTIDGRSVELVVQTQDSLYARAGVGDDQIALFSQFGNSDVVDGYYLRVVEDGDFTESLFVAGFDTDPTVISAASGSATYRGDVEFNMYRNQLNADGKGRFLIVADFDGQTISGDLAVQVDGIGHDGNADVDIIPTGLINLSLEPTPITQNGFSGTIVVADGELNGTLNSGSYDGRFFGAAGEAVGGGISGSISHPGFEAETVLNGIFAGPVDE